MILDLFFGIRQLSFLYNRRMRPKERYKFMARLPSNSDDRQIGENYIPDYNTIVAKNMKPKNIKTTNLKGDDHYPL
jgi:hypothetical protein